MLVNGMAKKFSNVYQFKIVLQEIKPLIWRRIQVPEHYSFWDLHVAIQDSMGWLDYHLHKFHIKNNPTRELEFIGIPDEDFDDEMAVLPGWEVPIKDFFTLENKKILYEYDFGDCWEHMILLEKILPKSPNVKYPICIAGARACPPEDCGGTMGYKNLLKIIGDPQHEEYVPTMEWLGGSFEPEKFNPSEVKFENPGRRLNALQ